MRIENRFFGEPWPLSLNVALFKYASREGIFIIKLWKWKGRFFKMSAPSAAPLDPSNRNITKSNQLLLDFSYSFEWCVWNKKASASSSSFQWLPGAARPLQSRRRHIRRQSLLGLDYSLNCTNISANCTAIAAFFIPNWARGGIWSFPSRKMSFLLLI